MKHIWFRMYTTRDTRDVKRATVCLPHETPWQRPHPVAYVARAMDCFHYGLRKTHDDDSWLSHSWNQSDPFIWVHCLCNRLALHKKKIFEKYYIKSLGKTKIRANLSDASITKIFKLKFGCAWFCSGLYTMPVVLLSEHFSTSKP